MWLTLPNALSFVRLLLGLAFPWFPLPWRLPIVIIAALSDMLDGSVGRATQTTSSIGRILDPVADKIFMLGVVVALILDQTLTVGQVLLLGIRDIAVVIRGCWEYLQHRTRRVFHFHPSFLGKITTALQFLVFGLIFALGSVQPWVFFPTVVVGAVAGVDYLLRPVKVEG